MSERVKRPRPERTAPIRNWSTLFTPPGSAATSGDDPPQGRRVDAASIADAVSRSVDIGYRVVDEYIRQGQKAAQRMSGGAYGPEALTNDSQQLFARMAQYASEFMALWFEAAGLAGSGLARDGAATARAPARPAAGRAPTRSATAEAIAAMPDRSGRVQVAIEVTSPYPIEVGLDLRPEATQSRLLVQALRAVDPDKPRIDDVAFQPAPETSDGALPRLRIRVGPEQPAGTYNALILDEQTSRPLGTLSVRILRP